MYSTYKSKLLRVGDMTGLRDMRQGGPRAYSREVILGYDVSSCLPEVSKPEMEDGFRTTGATDVAEACGRPDDVHLTLPRR